MRTNAERRHTRGSLRLALIFGLAFAAVAALVMAGVTTTFDVDVIQFVRRLDSPAATSIALAASWLGTEIVIVPSVVLLALLIARAEGRRVAVLYAATFVSGWLLHLAIKESMGRLRPEGISPHIAKAGWFSFPSGHATVAVLVFGMGALLLSRGVENNGRRWTMRAVGIVLVLLIGWSRIYLGAHWPTDVVAGIFFAAAWSAVCIVLGRRWSGIRRSAVTSATPAGESSRRPA